MGSVLKASYADHVLFALQLAFVAAGLAAADDWPRSGVESADLHESASKYTSLKQGSKVAQGQLYCPQVSTDLES